MNMDIEGTGQSVAEATEDAIRIRNERGYTTHESSTSEAVVTDQIRSHDGTVVLEISEINVTLHGCK